jgi:hypothetical protein
MFGFRLRILDARESEADPCSDLGIVEGFPNILVHAASVEQAGIGPGNALTEHLERLLDSDSTCLPLDDMPSTTCRPSSSFGTSSRRELEEAARRGGIATLPIRELAKDRPTRSGTRSCRSERCRPIRS